MEQVEAEGMWWLPSEPDRRVPGTLRVTSGGDISLSLIGHIGLTDWAPQPDSGTGTPVTQESLHRSGQYRRVHGETAKTGYTLDRGIRTFRSGIGHNVASEVIKFSQAFTGVWFDEDEPLNFDRASFNLQWLTEWVGESGIHRSTTLPERGTAGQMAVTGTVLPNRRVRIGEGRTVYLRHVLTRSGVDPYEGGVRQSFRFEVRSSTVVSSDELLDVAGRIQSLVSIGTGRTAGFETVAFQHPKHRGGPRNRYRLPIENIAEWSARDAGDGPLREHDMPFTLGHLGGLPTLGRWINATDAYQHQLDAVVATKYRAGFVSDRLLNRIAAVEGYHKVKHGPRGGNLRSRLTACVDFAGDAFSQLVGDAATWVQIAVVERNNVGHGSQSRYEPAHRLFIADAAYWLFVFCMLREMSAPEIVFERIVNNPEFRWLQHNLAVLMT